MNFSPKIKQVSLDEMMPLFRQQLAAGKRVRFGPKGTSMLPMLRQGIDTVELASCPETLKKYDLPLYQRRGGQYVLHRIVRAGDTYTCIGDNQYQLEKGLSYHQMIGVVTAFYRGDKRWEVTDWRYWLYCRLWHYSRPIRRSWLAAKNRLCRMLKK